MNYLKILSNYITIDVALGFLAVFFLYCFITIVKRAFEISTQIKTIFSLAKEAVGNAPQIDAEIYDSLTAQMKSQSLISHAWQEFDETVIRDDSEEHIQIFNTKSISVFFRKEDVLERHLSTPFYHKVPGILTSIGLLFTFLFIVFGLMDIHFEGKQVLGIDKLIDGLSAKFQSSVFALFLATIFTFVEHGTVRSVEKAYRDLIDYLDKLFRHKAGEDYLRQMDRNMRELNHSMKRFSTDLAGVIKEGLHEGMRPSTDRLLIAIENLEKQKSENIADTLTKALQEFKVSLNQSAGAEFAELGSHIGKLASVMNTSAEQSATMASKLNALVSSMDAQIAKQEKMGDSSIEKLNGGFERLLTFIEDSSRKQGDNIKLMMEELILRTGNATAGIISNVDSLSERNAKVAADFSSLTTNIEKSILKYNETLVSTQTLIGATGKVAESINNSLNEISALQTSIQRTYENFTQQSTVVLQIQKDNAVGVDRYRNVFNEVENGLEKILRQLADNMKQYNDLTKTGLQGYLETYDQSLSKATSKLSSTVKDLDEALEVLNDQFELIANKRRNNVNG